MKETVTFRVHANKRFFALYDRTYVVTDPLTEVVAFDRSDPRLPRFARLYMEWTHAGRLNGWALWDRRYTAKELREAPLLQLLTTSMFEPAGEEVGTIYDDSSACPRCGAGGKRVGELVLNLNRVPRGKDFAFTIARNELIVSERVAGIMQGAGITGYELKAVRHYSSRPSKRGTFYELVITGGAGWAHPRTEFGLGAYEPDEAGEYVCKDCGVSGLNIISELYLPSDVKCDTDWCQTRDMIGLRMGLLRPYHLIVISQRLYRLLTENKATGFKVEIVRFVPPE